MWGPYDYRNEKRGVDPELGVDEIYQIVFKDGYYYNVSPNFKKGDKTKNGSGFCAESTNSPPKTQVCCG